LEEEKREAKKKKETKKKRDDQSSISFAGRFLTPNSLRRMNPRLLVKVVCSPIRYNVIPRKVRSEAIQCGHFGLFRCEQKSSMLEGNNIALLGIPSPCKLCCTHRCIESNAIRSINYYYRRGL